MADAIGVRSTRTNGGPSSRSIKVGGDLRSPLILLEKENVSTYFVSNIRLLSAKHSDKTIQQLNKKK